MIDVESEIYTKIVTMLRTQFPGISVSGEYVNSPAHLPHVSIEQTDNYIAENRIDTSDAERFDVIAFDINVYSGSTLGKKSECKAIMSAIDSLMYTYNFKRLSLSPVPNRDDTTVYRMTARYRAETDGTYLYRR